MSPDRSPSTNAPMSRRTALRAGAAASAAGVGMTAAAASPVRAAQDAAGMQSEHLEVVFIPADPVTITLAGGGPPQRGDYFYVDGPIYAVDDVNGTQIGMYHCFGAWTSAADATDVAYHRLTTVQYLLDDGSIMGLINEIGDDPTTLVGAVQGGTGRFTGALGTFQQLDGPSAAEGMMATPGPGTPGAGQNVVWAVFDLILPQIS